MSIILRFSLFTLIVSTFIWTITLWTVTVNQENYNTEFTEYTKEHICWKTWSSFVFALESDKSTIVNEITFDMIWDIVDWYLIINDHKEKLVFGYTRIWWQKVTVSDLWIVLNENESKRLHINIDHRCDKNEKFSVEIAAIDTEDNSDVKIIDDVHIHTLYTVEEDKEVEQPDEYAVENVRYDDSVWMLKWDICLTNKRDSDAYVNTYYRIINKQSWINQMRTKNWTSSEQESCKSFEVDYRDIWIMNANKPMIQVFVSWRNTFIGQEVDLNDNLISIRYTGDTSKVSFSNIKPKLERETTFLNSIEHRASIQLCANEKGIDFSKSKKWHIPVTIINETNNFEYKTHIKYQSQIDHERCMSIYFNREDLWVNYAGTYKFIISLDDPSIFWVVEDVEPFVFSKIIKASIDDMKKWFFDLYVDWVYAKNWNIVGNLCNNWWDDIENEIARIALTRFEESYITNYRRIEMKREQTISIPAWSCIEVSFDWKEFIELMKDQWDTFRIKLLARIFSDSIWEEVDFNEYNDEKIVDFDMKTLTDLEPTYDRKTKYSLCSRTDCDLLEKKIVDATMKWSVSKKKRAIILCDTLLERNLTSIERDLVHIFQDILNSIV